MRNTWLQLRTEVLLVICRANVSPALSTVWLALALQLQRSPKPTLKQRSSIKSPKDKWMSAGCSELTVTSTNSSLGLKNQRSQTQAKDAEVVVFCHLVSTATKKANRNGSGGGRGTSVAQTGTAVRTNSESGVNFISKQKLKTTLRYTAEQHFEYERELFSKQLLLD